MEKIALSRETTCYDFRSVRTPIIQLISVLTLVLFSCVAFGQSTVSGRVTYGDSAISGITVQVKGSEVATQTNASGDFSLAATGKNVLVFTGIGFERQEVPLNDRSTLNVSLISTTQQLNDVVVVGYGTQKRSTITGSVASIGTKEIVANPTTNVLNGISGRLPGLTAMQLSGEPGNDNPLLLVRGIGTTGDASPLIILDGFPVSASDIARLDPQEVESMSVLKDAASAAVFGNRGGNGVIVVTTKRGKAGKTKITYAGNVGYQQPTRVPTPVDGYTEAVRYNEALVNDGLPPAFSDQQLTQIKDVALPYGNTNWFKELLKSSFQQSHTANLSGGAQNITYFLDFNHMEQNGYYKNSEARKNSFRANLDLQATASTKVSLDLSYRITKSTSPTSSIGDLYYSAYRAPSYLPVKFADDQFARVGTGNPLASASLGGYNNNDRNNLFTTIQVNQLLPIKGLSVKGLINFQRNTGERKTFNTPFPVYIYNETSGEAEPTEVSARPSLNQAFDLYKSVTAEAHLNYTNTFGDHTVGGLLLYSQTEAEASGFFASRGDYLSGQVDQLFAGSTTTQQNGNVNQYEEARQGIVGRLNYGFQNKYLVETNFRYDGSQNFPKGNRWGFFPSISVGWILSEENFIKNNVAFVDFLKLRASRGQLGNDKVAQYQFVSAYYLGAGYPFGMNRQYGLGLYQGPVPNPNITWERVTKTNVGLEARMFNGLLGIEVDYFKDRRTNILTPRSASVPASFGAVLPSENIGIVDNRGIELVLLHNNRVSSNITYHFRGNVAFARNKVVFIDEPENIPEAIKRTGRPLNQFFGYRAVGYFQSDDEILNSATQPNVKPGDVKYEDISGPEAKPDGVIDANDRVQIGKSNIPEITYGLSTGIMFKNLELNMFWQGASNYNLMMNSELSWAFFNGGQMLDYQQDYWTPENPNARFPRLTTQQHGNNNYGGDFNYGSTKWLYDASYIRLKNIELAYNFPTLGALKNANLRIYVNAFNLLTFSDVPLLDPENPNGRGWSYPQQKIYNAGIRLGF